MVSILLLGQAIVSYEIFTGKTLPRRGFLHLWRNTVILMGAICLLSAWEITRQAPSLYRAGCAGAGGVFLHPVQLAKLNERSAASASCDRWSPASGC